MKIRDAFQYTIDEIKLNDYVSFKGLKIAITYMLLKQMIHYTTYRQMRDLWSKPYKVIAETEENDGIYVVYPYASDSEEMDYFLKDKLIHEIYRILSCDKMLFSGKTRDDSDKMFEEFLSRFGDVEIPEYVCDNYFVLAEMADEAYLTDNGVLYYVYIEKSKARYTGTLMRTVLSNKTRPWRAEDGEILMTYVGTFLLYAPLENALYIQYPSSVENRVLKYNLQTDEITMLERMRIIWLNGKKELVYVVPLSEGRRELRVRSANEDKCIGTLDIRGKKTNVYNDYIIVSPSLFAKKIIKPYKMFYDGKQQELNEEEFSEYFWEYIYRSDICNSFYPENTIGGKLHDSEVKRPPKELTIRSIREHFDQITKYGMVAKGGYFPLNNTLTLLLKAGFLEDEDVSDLMFQLMDFSRRCMKNDHGRTLFSRIFYYQFYSIAKTENFKEKLIREPEKLFEANIIWNDEKIKEYYEEPTPSYKLAFFDIIDGRLEVEEKEEYVLKENMVLPSGNAKNMRGVVGYDFAEDKSVIFWEIPDKELMEEVKERLGKVYSKYVYHFSNGDVVSEYDRKYFSGEDEDDGGVEELFTYKDNDF